MHPIRINRPRSAACLISLIALLTGCDAPTLSCQSRLDTIKRQLSWQTPGIAVPPAFRGLIESAEDASEAGETDMCEKLVDELDDLPGIG